MSDVGAICDADTHGSILARFNGTTVTEDTVKKIRAVLEKSWSADTSVCFSPTAAPSYGQCAPTAIVVQEHFGGEILMTRGWHNEGRHFYNRIAGTRYDFTADQFEMPDYSHCVEYDDVLSSAAEAETEMLPSQLDSMRRAFQKALNESG